MQFIAAHKLAFLVGLAAAAGLLYYLHKRGTSSAAAGYATDPYAPNNPPPDASGDGSITVPQDTPVPTSGGAPPPAASPGPGGSSSTGPGAGPAVAQPVQTDVNPGGPSGPMVVISSPLSTQTPGGAPTGPGAQDVSGTTTTPPPDQISTAIASSGTAPPPTQLQHGAVFTG